MKILIIDDEIKICSALKKNLDIAGFQDITTCTDVYKAEKLLRTNQYDIVLLDLIMPQKKGDSSINIPG